MTIICSLQSQLKSSTTRLQPIDCEIEGRRVLLTCKLKRLGYGPFLIQRVPQRCSGYRNELGGGPWRGSLTA